MKWFKAIHPFGNLAAQDCSRAHGFASPPYGGFAFIEDEEVEEFVAAVRGGDCQTALTHILVTAVTKT